MARLVYGAAAGGLVFMDPDHAFELARLREALAESTTWGNLWGAVSERRQREIAARREDDGEPPDPETAFDPAGIPGYLAGEWPESPEREQIALLPEAVQSRFGSVVRQAGQSVLRLDAAAEEELLAALRDAGFTCERNDDLVRRAAGYEEASGLT